MKRQPKYTPAIRRITETLRRDQVDVSVAVFRGWLGGYPIDGYIASARMAILFYDENYEARARLCLVNGLLVLGLSLDRPMREIVTEVREACGIGRPARPTRQTHRTCLMCNNGFLSEGPWNRICPKCSRRPDIQSDLRAQERERRILIPKPKPKRDGN